ncbi:MAG: ABC transporter ATP-binding protein [Verrucomicrobiae bacterium]|nr:ABC transporter ATP-binding protein [Verrucomicrobiae bacterium]
MENPQRDRTSAAPREREVIVDVRGLTKRFADVLAVDGVDMKIRRGQVYGFLGPNGSGKTTFIRMLCGLLEPTAGEGTCLGYDILTQQREIKHHVGYMTQRFSLYEDLTVRENLDFTARLYGVADRPRRVAQSLEELGLAERRNQLAGNLSGGWKQRLSLGCALLHQPRLLLLDEPTAGVDPKARRDFWEQIQTMAEKNGLTVLITTHYMDEAERCHELSYLAYGRLLVRGTPADLLRHAAIRVWAIRGPELNALAIALREGDGLEQVVAFGNALHVVSDDPARIRAALGRHLTPAHTAEEIEPGLDDVFIHLMEKSSDNFS